jgi:hypothetical protein
MALWKGKLAPAATALDVLSARRTFDVHVPPTFDTSRGALPAWDVSILVQVAARLAHDDVSGVTNCLGQEIARKEIILSTAEGAGFGLHPQEVLHMRETAAFPALCAIEVAD